MKIDVQGHYLNGKAPPPYWEHMEVLLAHGSPVRLGNCPYCNQALQCQLHCPGVAQVVGETPCPYPEGLPPAQWEMAIPSGAIVVANDVRELYPTVDSRQDIETPYTEREYVLSYARAGLSFTYTGNESPQLHDIGEDAYQLGGRLDAPILARINASVVFCSICDAEDFKARVLSYGLERVETQQIPVKPGVYRFQHQGRTTTLAWVRDV